MCGHCHAVKTPAARYNFRCPDCGHPDAEGVDRARDAARLDRARHSPSHRPLAARAWTTLKQCPGARHEHRRAARVAACAASASGPASAHGRRRSHLFAEAPQRHLQVARHRHLPRRALLPSGPRRDPRDGRQGLLHRRALGSGPGRARRHLARGRRHPRGLDAILPLHVRVRRRPPHLLQHRRLRRRADRPRQQRQVPRLHLPTI